MSDIFRIFNSLPFSSLVVEPVNERFIIVDANRKYCESFAKKREVVKGEIYPQMDSWEFSSKVEVKQMQTALENAFTSGESCSFKKFRTWQKRKSITSYWKIEITPLRDDCGEIIQLLITALDQTCEVLERQEIEQELLLLKEQQELYIHKNPDGLYSLDKEGNFLSLNEGLANLTEKSEKELLKKSFIPFCAPHHLDLILTNFHRALAGENRIFEADFISARNREMVLEISLVPTRLEGEISGVYGIAKDKTLLRKKEEELQRNQKKFQALVQEGSDLVAIMGPDGIYKFVSSTTQNVLGMSPEFLEGKNAFEFIHPEDKERVLREFSVLKTENQVRIKAFRFKDGTGNWRWVETQATNCLNDPYIEGIVVNSREITELVEQSREIKQLYERYALAANATEDLIYDWNLETDEVIRFHKSNKSFFGHSREEIDQRDFWRNHIEPGELPDLKMLLKNSLTDPERTTLKTHYRFRRADGSYAQIIDRANIVRNEHGKAIRLIGATSDVSQLMNDKNALKLANMRFNYAMKATKEMIWDWDIQQGVINRSGIFKKIFGYDTSKDISVTNFWFHKIVEEDRERIKSSLEEALKDPEIKKWKEEYTFFRKNGERAHVIDRGYILRDAKGTAIRMVGAVLDVTESRRMLREIRKQNKVLKEVAWEQAHIVRAPLARLKGLLDLLEDESFEEWSREELVGLIRKSADEVDNVIANIIRKTEKIEK